MKEYFNKKQLRIQLIVVVLFLLITCVVGFLFQKKETIDLLNSKEFVIETFSDVWDGGHSQCAFITKTKDEVTFKCCLKKGLQYPYAGIHYRRIDGAFYSLNNYKMEMQITVGKRQRLPVRIYNFKEGISDSTIRNSFALYHNVYTVEKGENNLGIPFNSFTTIPEWWYTNNKTSELDLKSWDKDSVGYTSIFSDAGFTLDDEKTFKITKLLLVGDYTDLYWKFAAFSITVLILFFGTHFLVYQKQKRIQLTIKYSDDFDFETESGDLKNQIHTFISEQYSNSELKAIDLANYLHVPEYKIGEILKEHVGMSFKAFLNHTRVEAAKLYLKNSSYSISEIAYKTGFNSPSSFNRVFKEIVKQAPGEFKN